jgi:hypothetical protein
VDTVIAPLASLTVGGPDGGQLVLGQLGQLTINHDFTQDETGTLTINIAGASAGQFGKLIVDDQALLNGNLQIQSVDGFVPSAGAQFEFLSATGGLAGTTFSSPSLVPDLSGNVVWQLTYAPNVVIASVLSGTTFGDLDGDNELTPADWSLFKSGQGTSFSGLTQLQAYLRGDVDGDFDHDLADFVAFRAAYENAHGAGSFASLLGNVPEPSSITLHFAAALIFCCRHPTRFSEISK